MTNEEEEITKCPRCGSKNSRDATFCQMCGAQLRPALMLERGHLPKKSAIGLAILFIGAVIEIKAFEGQSVHWYMVIIGILLICIGYWGAYWGFSATMGQMAISRLKRAS